MRNDRYAWKVFGAIAKGGLIGVFIGCIVAIVVLISMLIWPECILFRPMDW